MLGTLCAISLEVLLCLEKAQQGLYICTWHEIPCYHSIWRGELSIKCIIMCFRASLTEKLSTAVSTIATVLNM